MTCHPFISGCRADPDLGKHQLHVGWRSTSSLSVSSLPWVLLFHVCANVQFPSVTSQKLHVFFRELLFLSHSLNVNGLQTNVEFHNSISSIFPILSLSWDRTLSISSMTVSELFKVKKTSKLVILVFYPKHQNYSFRKFSWPYIKNLSSSCDSNPATAPSHQECCSVTGVPLSSLAPAVHLPHRRTAIFYKVN